MELFIKIRLLLLFAFLFIATTFSNTLFAQCNSSNIFVSSFELRKPGGGQFTNTDNYVIGQQVIGEIWVLLDANSSTNSYSLLASFNAFLNGSNSPTKQFSSCLFPNTKVLLKNYFFVTSLTWNWGDKVEIKDIVLAWRVNSSGTCPTTDANNQCYKPTTVFTAAIPLYPNFIFSGPPCDSNTVTFTNQTIGGTPPYTYSWNFGGQGTSTLKDPTFTFTQPGSYSVSLTATDNLAPTKTTTTFTKTVTIPSPITISATTTSTQINGTTGSINVTVTGGTPFTPPAPPYTYSWTGPNGFTSNSEDISSLSKGIYRVEVTDAKGCRQTAEFTIHDLLTSDFTFTSFQCNSRIQFTSSTAGGTPPLNYTYEWDFNNDGNIDSNSANPIFDFPGSGTYPVTLTVKNGTSSLTISKSVFIDPNFGIQVTIFPTKKNEESGEIYVESVTGGTPLYTYYWTGPDGFTSTNKDIFNLKDGLYQLVVTDANGCQQTEQFEMEIASVLNLEWNSYEVEFKGEVINVSWEMNSETLGTEYHIHRSFGNISNFETIKTIISQNQSQSRIKYEFTDKNFSRFETYIYYRIEKKQGENSQFSPVKMIKLENLTPRETWLVYPNPSAGGYFNLNYLDANASLEEQVTLELFDAGNFFRKTSLPIRSGQTLKLNEIFGTLPKGILFLRIQNAHQVKVLKLMN